MTARSLPKHAGLEAHPCRTAGKKQITPAKAGPHRKRRSCPFGGQEWIWESVELLNEKGTEAKVQLFGQGEMGDNRGFLGGNAFFGEDFPDEVVSRQRGTVLVNDHSSCRNGILFLSAPVWRNMTDRMWINVCRHEGRSSGFHGLLRYHVFVIVENNFARDQVIEIRPIGEQGPGKCPREEDEDYGITFCEPIHGISGKRPTPQAANVRSSALIVNTGASGQGRAPARIDSEPSFQ